MELQRELYRWQHVAKKDEVASGAVKQDSIMRGDDIYFLLSYYRRSSFFLCVRRRYGHHLSTEFKEIDEYSQHKSRQAQQCVRVEVRGSLCMVNVMTKRTRFFSSSSALCPGPWNIFHRSLPSCVRPLHISYRAPPQESHD